MSELKALEELREYAKQPDYGYWENEFSEIADAIQAEVDERFIELPVDRNGETLRIGDEVWFHDDEDGATPHVVRGYGMTNGRDVDVFLNFADEGWCPNTVTVPDVLVHRKPRTLEDVLNDFAYKVCDLNVDEREITKYADEIRELMGADA